jgi:hypothetical protein
MHRAINKIWVVNRALQRYTKNTQPPPTKTQNSHTREHTLIHAKTPFQACLGNGPEGTAEEDQVYVQVSD